MLIMSLDPATVLGFAVGVAGAVPTSGSVRLKKPHESPDVAAFNTLCFLRDRWILDKPDLVCIESFLNPIAQKSADAVILQIQCFGVIVAMCQAYSIRYETAQPSTVRKHFIGRANMGDRKSTKRAVLDRAKLLGYLDRSIFDDNRADAIALWSFAECSFGRVTPARLTMFELEGRA